MARITKDYDERYTEFLDVGQALFYSKGYEPTSVQEIIKAYERHEDEKEAAEIIDYTLLCNLVKNGKNRGIACCNVDNRVFSSIADIEKLTSDRFIARVGDKVGNDQARSIHKQARDQHAALSNIAIGVRAEQANGFARSDKVVELDVDFGARLTALGEAGSFDENSVRVVEVDVNGTALDTAVPFQFDNGSTLNEPSGTLVWLLTGSTAANASRYYEVYFDAAGSFTTASFTDRVEQQSDQWVQGQQSYQIVTKDADGSANTAFYYHKIGGGFARVYDRDGNDWVGYQSGAGTKSGGEYRGIPNLGKVFHPGYSGSAGSNNQGSNSSVLDDGPLKLTYRSISYDGNYTAVWAIYPTFAQMTVTIGDGSKYWMLYEGTPGGELDYSSAPKDYVVLSNNTQLNVDQTFNADLSEDWVYVADGSINRSLFVAHSPNDTIVDSFRDQDDFPSNGSEADAMTVFGFGRDQTKGVTRLLSAENATYTFGLVDNRDFTDVSGVINNATQDVLITIGNDAPTVETNGGVTVDVGETAVFTPTNLTTTDPEGGKITYTIETTPAHGSLMLVDTPLSVSNTFTQADIDGGALVYEQGGSQTTSDTFTLSAADDVQSTADFAVNVTINTSYEIYLPMVIDQ